MKDRRPMIYARVDPAFMDRVQAEADLRFEGNQSLLLRDAMRLYLRLRTKLGVGFEPTIEAIAGPEPQDTVAA